MAESPRPACCCRRGSSEPSGTRRSFFARGAALLCGIVAPLVPTLVGLVTFFGPLRQKGLAGGFIQVAPLRALPDDAMPRRFAVIADRSDAWNRFVKEPIGAVYLRRLGPSEVQALQVTCPHAGCSINIESSPQGAKFFCPCHAASFDLSGKRIDSTSPSPRDMDVLDVEIRNQSEIWVKFQDFRTGTSGKVALA